MVPPVLTYATEELLHKLQQQLENLQQTVAWRYDEALRERDQLRLVYSRAHYKRGTTSLMDARISHC